MIAFIMLCFFLRYANTLKQSEIFNFITSGRSEFSIFLPPLQNPSIPTFAFSQLLIFLTSAVLSLIPAFQYSSIPKFVFSHSSICFIPAFQHLPFLIFLISYLLNFRPSAFTPSAFQAPPYAYAACFQTDPTQQSSAPQVHLR